uniref:Rab-like protein 3 n=1 Tax=Mesocestoides corti TaxID=53468 RepID=A0A5K3EL10_MESCO
MCDYDRLKVVVAGDSGVGKTAFVHLLCYGEALLNPSWTVGCSVELTIFPRPRGDLGGAQVKAEERFFVEFWDIGGSARHANTRSVFYDGLHGIILVHDLTNKKSETNLKKWLAELTSRSSHLSHSADSGLFATLLIPIGASDPPPGLSRRRLS